MIFKDAESKIQSKKLEKIDENLIPEELKNIPKNYGWNLENKKEYF